jgi:hypothetical protein
MNRYRRLSLESQEELPVEYNGYPGLEIIASCHDCEEIFSFVIQD